MSKYTAPLPDDRTAKFEKHDNLSSNPFVYQDKDLPTYRREEVEEKTQKKILLRDQKVCDKTTFATLENDTRPNEDKEKHQLSEKYGRQSTLSRTGLYQLRRQTLRNDIAERRKLFLAQFSIDTKQEAIREMKTILSKEKEKISEAERKLQEDAQTFEELLKESDRNVAEALKLADQETKAKLEKISENQKVIAEIRVLKSDVAKCEETLKEYKLYENFLRMLSPSEWRDAQNEKRIIRDATKKRNSERKLTLPFLPITKSADGELMRLLSKAESMRQQTYFPCHKSSVSESRRSSTRTPSEASADDRETQTGDSDSEEEPELYFTDPQQLHQIFADLEKQNVTLLEKAQELDETMQDFKARTLICQETMNQKTQTLKEHIKMFSEALVREQEQIAELELKVKTFTVGNLKLEDQDKMLSILKKKVTDVYTCCIGEVQAPINTVQMLLSIENRLGELEDLLEPLPKEMMEAALKAKLKERRRRLHQEKLKDELVKREKLMIRILEKAAAHPCKTEGRKLMKRSEPPPQSRRQNKMDAQKLAAQKEADQYFFT